MLRLCGAGRTQNKGIREVHTAPGADPTCLNLQTWPAYNECAYLLKKVTFKKKKWHSFIGYKLYISKEKYLRDTVSRTGICSIISKGAYWLRENFANLFCFVF